MMNPMNVYSINVSYEKGKLTTEYKGDLADLVYGHVLSLATLCTKEGKKDKIMEYVQASLDYINCHNLINEESINEITK